MTTIKRTDQLRPGDVIVRAYGLQPPRVTVDRIIPWPGTSYSGEPIICVWYAEKIGKCPIGNSGTPSTTWEVET